MTLDQEISAKQNNQSGNNSVEAQHGAKAHVPKAVMLWSNMAAVVVVVLSTIIAGYLLYTLHQQIMVIENSANRTDLTSFVNAQTAEKNLSVEKLTLLGQLLMESDAQFLRSERAQSLVGARLLVNIGSVLVGLTLTVIGGALVLARIRGSTTFQQSGPTTGQPTYEFVSNVPGVVLCVLGAIVVIWTLNVSVHENALQRTTDAALFFPPSHGATAVSILNARNVQPKILQTQQTDLSEDEKTAIREQCIKSLGEEFC